MVGVPGRSKGCHTCRARKKGCDLQRPYCGQCINGNFICRGYQRKVTFIPHDQPVTRILGEATIGRDSTSAYFNNPLARRIAARSNQGFNPLPEDLHRTALEVKSFGIFWDLYLPKARCSSAVAEWAKVVQDLSPRHDVSRLALLAVSVSRIGRNNKDSSMIENGMELYGRALLRVNRTLQDQNQAQGDEILAACRLLSFYEQFNVPRPSTIPEKLSQARNWQHHVQGSGKLIELREPRKLCSKYGHRMFVEARMSGVILAIANRKTTFLSTPEWSTVPWEGTPKTIRDELIDIMVLVPHICEEFDKINACRDISRVVQRGQILVGKCWKLDDYLQKWYREFIFQLFGHVVEAERLSIVQTINTVSDEPTPEFFYE
ncbi:hypothetical protein AOQ84DRAFT_395 [Glonium stellatum]|uniref:Zn(2)-C6 fungal-type domain-containing protein n=1 Tax=Glonium stellatum TaxID=574774 RepID=A0A8E2F4Q3_9PEZI|nr:hypothetical protein AOQ84DRAFT_395 [Glonium stellatum]